MCILSGKVLSNIQSNLREAFIKKNAKKVTFVNFLVYPPPPPGFRKMPLLRRFKPLFDSLHAKLSFGIFHKHNLFSSNRSSGSANLCPFVCPDQTCLELLIFTQSSCNLHAVSQQSVSSQLAVSQRSVSSQLAVYQHSQHSSSICWSPKYFVLLEHYLCVYILGRFLINCIKRINTGMNGDNDC